MKIRFLLCWMLAGLLEIPFLCLLLGIPVSRPLLGLHLLAAVLLFFSFPKNGLNIAFALLALVFPVLGWGASSVLFFTYHPNPHFQGLPKEEETSFVNGEGAFVLSAQKTSRQERILQELDFMPLADILKGEDGDLKRGAIEKMAALKTPEMIDCLLTHRSDHSMEVRFYVTSALARIKKEFDEELDAAKQEMQKDIYNIAARVFLAKIYLQFAESHLLDSFTTKTYEDEAVYHLRFAVDSGNASAEAYWMLISAYTESADWKKALEAVCALETRNDVSLAEVAQMKARIFYRMRDFAALQNQLGQMKKDGFFDKAWSSLALWWGV